MLTKRNAPTDRREGINMNKSRRDSNGLNKRERDILKFIQKEIITNGFAPSVREICKAVGLNSTATVQGYLKTLEERGYVKKENQKADQNFRKDGQLTSELVIEIRQTPQIDHCRSHEQQRRTNSGYAKSGQERRILLLGKRRCDQRKRAHDTFGQQAANQAEHNRRDQKHDFFHDDQTRQWFFHILLFLSFLILSPL